MSADETAAGAFMRIAGMTGDILEKMGRNPSGRSDGMGNGSSRAVYDDDFLKETHRKAERLAKQGRIDDEAMRMLNEILGKTDRGS